MSVTIPDWLLLLLLLMGGGALLWLLLIILTFIGLWAVHPRDANDDIPISDRKKYK